MKRKIFLLSLVCAMSLVTLNLSAATDDNESEATALDVTTVKGGNLAEVLGGNIETVDSLVVRGPLNDADFKTLWEGTFYHQLKVINLEFADIENNKLPDCAFYNEEVQTLPNRDSFKSIGLRRIILPDNLESFGNDTFYHAYDLEQVNLPINLTEMGYGIFEGCKKLKFEDLKIPECVTKIGGGAFEGCKSITGRLYLPASLKIIGVSAFAGSGINYVEIPADVILDQRAFANTQLKEAYISGSCLCSDLIFAFNKALEKLIISEGMIELPIRIAYDCPSLKEIRIPSTVTEISIDALDKCISLKKVELPDGLERILGGGLRGLQSLEEIVFPENLKELQVDSCTGWKAIQRIYSKSPEPPGCEEALLYPPYTPFGSKEGEAGDNAPRDTPIYVPVGSAEKYRTAPGWDYFNNYIETSEFPESGVEEIFINTEVNDNSYYDLQGRKITNPQPGQIYIQNGKKFIFSR